jgi:hypothetical protein
MEMAQIRRLGARLRVVTLGSAVAGCLVVLVAATIGCTRRVSAAHGRTIVRLAIGSQALVDVYKKELPDVTFEMAATGGSVTHADASGSARDALVAVLAGHRVRHAAVKAVGCLLSDVAE